MATVVTNTLTFKVSLAVSGDAKSITPISDQYTGNNNEGVAVVVPANAVNLHIGNIFVPHTAWTSGSGTGLILFAMSGSQNLTIKTNNSSTPTDTYNMTSRAGAFWTYDGITANSPLSGTITDLYITNLSSTDAKFDLRALYS